MWAPNLGIWSINLRFGCQIKKIGTKILDVVPKSKIWTPEILDLAYKCPNLGFGPPNLRFGHPNLRFGHLNL